MKHADITWIQSLARKVTGKKIPDPSTPQAVQQAAQFFLDELCALMADYSSYFNDLIKNERPEACFRVFKLGHPRPGLMLLRGKDKLVISHEGARIRIRIVHIQAFNERAIDVTDFDAHISNEDEIIWLSNENKARVTPEIVAKDHLGRFLVHGAAGFSQIQKNPQSQNRSQSSTDTLEV